MKKTIIVLGVIILILSVFLITNITGLVTLKNKEVIKIGVLTDLSGGMSSFGTAVREGIEIAREESNTNIKIIYQDSKCDLKEGTNAINKLINIDKVDVVFGTVCSHVTLAASKITEDNKKILLSVAASSPEITHAGGYVYRLWPSDLLESKDIIKHISNEMSEIKTLGILYMNNDYGVSVKNALIYFSKESDLEVTILESFLQNDTDFKTQLLKIKEKSPDGIFIISNPKEAVIIFNQIKEMNIEKQLFAPGWLIEDETVYLNISQDVLERIIFPSLEFNISNDFLTKTNNLNPTITALSYDGYKMLEKIIDVCKKDNECIKQELDVVSYKGVSGDIEFDEFGDVIKSFKIKRFKEGKNKIIN
jgi:branched-chain amino acid transport system substrate-binding protein